MLSYDEAGDALDLFAEELPPEFYRDLNGGIVLDTDAKAHPELPEDKYLVLGEYIRDTRLGNHVRIYYGSFVRTFPYVSDGFWRKKLREVLRHEMRHHVENLAGVRDLELEDEAFLARAKAMLAQTNKT